MARKPKPIDLEKIKKMAMIGCTVEEVAFVEGVSKDTIERRAMKAMDEGRATGRVSLRREQWHMAHDRHHKGQAVMLKWLGIQILGQKNYDLRSISDAQLTAEVERRMRERNGE